MKLSELKYLLSYTIPLVTLIALLSSGWMTFLVLLFAYGLLPFLELFTPGTDVNMSTEEEADAKVNPIFDWMLYMNVPIQYGLIGLYFYNIGFTELSTLELVGMTVSMGICSGVLGINVAHELGHRHKKHEQLMAQALLLTSGYTHFFVEHNRGHHKHVSTPVDPATSQKGEIIYTFWFRSMIMGYFSAWNIENSRLKRQRKKVFSWKNQMVRFTVLQLAFAGLITAIVGPIGLPCYILVSFIGGLQLESVNYIEHYGLMRKEIRPGVYERVQPHHSWNSNHSLGRIILFELTRHSDHHYLASRKYQVLRHFEESPQLPTGYPGMIIVALIPPLWFSIMDKKVAEYELQPA